MRSFWIHIKASWNYGRQFPYVEEADGEDFWTNDDSQNVLNFLKSYSGRKFKIRLRNFGIQVAMSEAMDLTTPRGKASGALALVSYIEAHAKPEEVEPESKPETIEVLETVGT